MNKRIQVLGGLAAIVAAALGLFVLGTWWFGAWRVATFGADYVPMAPSTAVLFTVLGLAVAAQRWLPAENRAASWIATITAAGAAGAAGLVLSQHWYGWSLPWQTWFDGHGQYVGAVPIGRMSPLTAVVFLLSALALAGQGAGTIRSVTAACTANAAAVVGLLIGLVVALGYATGTPMGYGNDFVPMALLTALGFLVLNLGLLLSGRLCPVIEAWRRHACDPDLPGASSNFNRRLMAITGGIVALLGLAGFFYIRTEQTSAREQAFAQLEAIATLKAQQITQWRQERLAEAQFLMHTPAVAADITALLNQPDSQAARVAVSGWLESIKADDRYEAILMYDAQANLRLALPASAARDVATPRATIMAALAERKVQQQGMRLIDAGQRARFNLLVPIMPVHASGADVVAPIALISLRLNPAGFLYPLIQSWPIPSDTAESLLVQREGREVVFLNELRHRAGAALTIRHSVDDRLLPAARAVRGATGVQEGRDYRGVAVLATSRAIPGTSWYLIAKIDQTEVYAPIRREVWQTGALLALLLLAVMGAAAFVWRLRHLSMLQRALLAERERSDFSERLTLLTRHANDIILLLDENWRIVEANERALDAYGYTLEELQRLPPGGLRAPGARAQLEGQIHEFTQPEGARFETVHQRKDGRSFPVEVSGRVVKIGDHQHVLVIYRDLTERKAHEAEIERFNRLYAALSQVNQAIVHATGRESLLQEICRSLVEFGHFKLAWIGRPDPATGLVVPVARHGDHSGYLDRVQIRADDSPQAGGPTGRAIRERRTQVSNDFLTDPTTRPWHEEARAEGIHASIALPVLLPGQTCSALTVYAAEPGYFGPKEIALLEEAALDASFGLENLEREANRQQMEAEARRLTQRLSLATDAASIGIWDWDLQADQWYATPTYFTMLGYQPEEGFSNRQLWLERLHPEDRVAVSGKIQEVLSGNEAPYQYEARMRHADGGYRWIYVAGRVLARDEQGKASRMLGVRIDITERKQAEAALRDSELRYRTFINASTDLIFLKDDSLRYLISNRANSAFLGKAHEAEVIGGTDFDFMPKAAAEGCQRSDQAALAAEGVVVNEEAVGASIYQTVKFPVPLAGGAVGVGGFIRDITKRRQAEDALRASQQLIEGIINTIPVRVFWKDKQLVYLGCNRAFARDAGLDDPTELIGKEDTQLVWREQAESYRADDRQVIASGIPKLSIEESQTTPEGKMISLLTNKLPLRDAEGEICGVLGTYMDITEHKCVENKLREQLEELQRWHEITLGRENRVLELKREINRLLAAAGQPPRYGSAEPENASNDEPRTDGL